MKKILLLGSGELGKEFVIAAKRAGQYVVACDRYAIQRQVRDRTAALQCVEQANRIITRCIDLQIRNDVTSPIQMVCSGGFVIVRIVIAHCIAGIVQVSAQSVDVVGFHLITNAEHQSHAHGGPQSGNDADDIAQNNAAQQNQKGHGICNDIHQCGREIRPLCNN